MRRTACQANSYKTDSTAPPGGHTASFVVVPGAFPGASPHTCRPLLEHAAAKAGPGRTALPARAPLVQSQTIEYLAIAAAMSGMEKFCATVNTPMRPRDSRRRQKFSTTK